MSAAIAQGRLVPDAVFGVVVSAATKVELTFTDGTTEAVPTIPPPPALGSGLLDFYVARRPCGTTYKRIVGLDANGKIVARATGHLNPRALAEAC
jgi:hypothetical protein